MIAGAALSAWLNDPVRQDASGRTIQDFANRWRDTPFKAQLQRAVEEMPARGAADYVAIARKFVERHDDFETLMEEAIAACAADPFFRVPLRLMSSDIHSGLLLFDHRDMTISLGTVPVDAIAAAKTAERGATSIFFSGQWMVLHFVKSGGATLSFWEAPQIEAGFVADAGDRCRLLGRRRVADGETLVIDGRSKSFVFDHAEADMVVVQALISAEAAPLTVGYYSDTLAFAGASSTDEESSRTQMLVSLLRMMDRADAAPLFRQALDSPHFYTRWHIMREFLALDAEAALPSLRAMAANDPHPEIRWTAGQTLSMLFPADDPESESAIACHA